MELVSKIKKHIKRLLNNLIQRITFTPNEPPFIISNTKNIQVGRNSFHNGNLTIKGKGNLKIGAFCAIGQDVKIILSNHNYNYPSIQHSIYENLFKELPYDDNCNNNTNIGNDVWIGDNVIILPNVIIEDGVCIGAGSIVTKHMPAYAICAGNPAKIIKYRFNESQINNLQKTKWWNWTDEEILQKRDFFFKIPFDL